MVTTRRSQSWCPPNLRQGAQPGDEYTYVLQGTLELSAEGRETRRASAGDVVHNPRGLVHEARNVGDLPARVVVTFVIDKGKPITQYPDK